jgi:transposase-like protein
MEFKLKTPESIINEVDAAKILGLSPYTLRSWRQQARNPLAFYKIGGAIRYKENEVLALLSNSRVPQALEVFHETA